MKRIHGIAIAGLALLLVFAVGRPAAAQADEATRIRNAAAVFNEIMRAPDRAIPQYVLDRAVGVAVFPGVLKAGFVVGGEHGKGIISVRDAKTGAWSDPAFLTITGGSWGAQIGGESVDLVLVIMNRRGLDNLLSDQFTLGGSASAAAGPVGRTAEAATDVQLHAEILSYSRSRGLFAGVTLNGASVHQDQASNQAFYGRSLTTQQIVLEHDVKRAPQPVALWQSALARYFPATTTGH